MNARAKENLTYFQNPYVRAFAWAIMEAEGTTTHGYYTYYGGSRLASLAWHPSKAIKVGGWTSSASGAFQFLTDTWNGLAYKLGLTDFGVDSQNAAFVELLREKNALTSIMQGDIDTTVYRVRKVWASLPGAGYGQGEKTLEQVRNWYQSALTGNNLPPKNPNSEMAMSAGTMLVIGLVLFLVLD